MQSYDATGWWAGQTSPWPAESAWTLFAREDDSRMLEARWRQQAKRFFGAAVAVSPAKQYPAGSQPRADRATVRIGVLGAEPAELELQTFPVDLGASLRSDALAIADSGLEMLVHKSPRIWQWRALGAAQPGAELRLAALLTSLLLGPVWSPADNAVFGVRGARLRLERG